jgi:hypothetical protein
VRIRIYELRFLEGAIPIAQLDEETAATQYCQIQYPIPVEISGHRLIGAEFAIIRQMFEASVPLAKKN